MNLAEEFSRAGIPINLLHASSTCISNKMQVQTFFLDPVKGFLSLGMVPLIGGDMIYDRAMGFSVGSGDQLTALLAKKFAAKRVIFATDVRGLSSGDPKKNPDATIIPEITIEMLGEIINNTDNSALRDASGAMRGKLQAIRMLSDEILMGAEVNIISMLEYGNLKSLLIPIKKEGVGPHTKFVP